MRLAPASCLLANTSLDAVANNVNAGSIDERMKAYREESDEQGDVPDRRLQVEIRERSTVHRDQYEKNIVRRPEDSKYRSDDDHGFYESNLVVPVPVVDVLATLMSWITEITRALLHCKQYLPVTKYENQKWDGVLDVEQEDAEQQGVSVGRPFAQTITSPVS